MFSEVKGPGDRLSETQENWIDFLASLGGTLDVELCHLRETNEDGASVPSRKNSNVGINGSKNGKSIGRPRKGSKSS
jgi:hypothetical protein